ncbi:hypothetical protein EV193_1011078 [Herbihabitans rhizosphaerae]|uniref:Elongation factor Tu-like protein n=1 Tax=Herbihabitans rhizosphaerae TaxID=1872711 RepID=A0A4Q7L931_9PSEU|nr:hypothetical protein [Herbihabitans rhizosphaerae]RZS45191.1 hypothetical protein EV193_1011078 [Herbihabitans rhizosphaerae]
MIEFAELAGGPVPEGGGIRVTGRCHSGPIHVGDTFTELVHANGRTERISLCVKEIVIYGRVIDTLDKGVSARLLLAGGSTVTPRALLRGSPAPLNT